MTMGPNAAEVGHHQALRTKTDHKKMTKYKNEIGAGYMSRPIKSICCSYKYVLGCLRHSDITTVVARVSVHIFH